MQEKIFTNDCKKCLTFAKDRIIINTGKSKSEVNAMRIDRVKFAAALARLDLNGNQLAEKAGVSRGTVTAVRTGKSCSKETADKLAAVLGREIIEEVRP